MTSIAQKHCDEFKTSNFCLYTQQFNILGLSIFIDALNKNLLHRIDLNAQDVLEFIQDT